MFIVSKMAYILKKFSSYYNYAFDDAVDMRTKDYPLSGKPYQVLTIVVLYQMFVFRWGPKWMKNRQPFNIDRIVMAYDLLQIFCCGYLFCAAIPRTWPFKYRWICEPLVSDDSENDFEVAKLIYFYFLLKISDLLDTVFFVLRKKSNQISFLHTYHHTLMVIALWIGTTYLPGGHGIYFCIINCFVHVVMYGYYFITLASPQTKQYIWLKKLVTQIQIIQFLLNTIQMGSILIVADCNYPRWPALLFVPNNTLMLILFVQFYIKAYIRKPKVDKFN